MLRPKCANKRRCAYLCSHRSPRRRRERRKWWTMGGCPRPRHHASVLALLQYSIENCNRRCSSLLIGAAAERRRPILPISNARHSPHASLLGPPGGTRRRPGSPRAETWQLAYEIRAAASWNLEIVLLAGFLWILSVQITLATVCSVVLRSCRRAPNLFTLVVSLHNALMSQHGHGGDASFSRPATQRVLPCPYT